jgi:hypothetical protein
MIPLLADVIEAHGGFDRWNARRRLTATIVSGGELWALKGIDQNQDPRTLQIELHRQWASVEPYGRTGRRAVFTTDHIAIEADEGRIVAERRNPRASFAGHDMRTSWDALHRAYFGGYALWTYLTTPFLLALDGFEVCEIEPWREGQETWRGLRAIFPSGIASHSTEQDFYFGADMLIRRHDYAVDIAGGFAAAQYIYDSVEVEGFRIPTKRRAYLREANLTPLLDEPMVTIDLSDFRFS